MTTITDSINRRKSIPPKKEIKKIFSGRFIPINKKIRPKIKLLNPTKSPIKIDLN
jgi:hypothetical protein